ncbi:hypothetical protein K4K54_011925 [Colletotrichum sp. SAR 10_86]|nr:hypothetical protein K4K54_011925 [Colletotrichum sp. SAR 10_86]
MIPQATPLTDTALHTTIMNAFNTPKHEDDVEYDDAGGGNRHSDSGHSLASLPSEATIGVLEEELSFALEMMQSAEGRGDWQRLPSAIQERIIELHQCPLTRNGCELHRLRCQAGCPSQHQSHISVALRTAAGESRQATAPHVDPSDHLPRANKPRRLGGYASPRPDFEDKSADFSEMHK